MPQSSETTRRHWLPVDHSFVFDSVFQQAAEETGASPALCQNVALLCAVRDNEGCALTTGDLERLTWFHRVAADLIDRILAVLHRLGTAVARSALTVFDRRARHRAAQARYRARRRRDPRQLAFLLPITGSAAAITRDHADALARSPSITPDHARSPKVNDFNDRVIESDRSPRSPSITPDHARSPKVNDFNDRTPQRDRSPVITREPLREKEREKDSKEGPELDARSARLAATSAALPTTPEQTDWLKLHKRDLLVQKLCRFVNATMPGEGAAAAYAGLLADDPREVQRWLDKLDLDMRAKRWDDPVRERRRA